VTDGDARVTYHEAEGKWAVDVEGAAWAASRHDKKNRAEQVGRAVAEEQGAELIVEEGTGQIEEQ
jgi:membrane protein implicated in regulation of membrane protease activity